MPRRCPRRRVVTRIRQLLHPVLHRVTGQSLLDLLTEYDRAKRLVTASPGRIALLTQPTNCTHIPTDPPT